MEGEEEEVVVVFVCVCGGGALCPFSFLCLLSSSSQLLLLLYRRDKIGEQKLWGRVGQREGGGRNKAALCSVSCRVFFLLTCLRLIRGKG